MNDTISFSNAVPASESVTLSIMGHEIELTFSENEDAELLNRLRQTLFQTYIQNLAYPQ